MSTTKRVKANEARKNAEALKAQKKAMRAARSSNAIAAGPAKKGQKGPSLIKSAKKKR